MQPAETIDGVRYAVVGEMLQLGIFGSIHAPAMTASIVMYELLVFGQTRDGKRERRDCVARASVMRHSVTQKSRTTRKTALAAP